MKFKNIIATLLVLVATFSLADTVSAIDQGAYYVYANTNYWNPDTGEIDDGGTANAALGEGMCRSATDTRALVEKDGDKYYVTIRLLLQSNTNTTSFWKHNGYNTYEQVNYEIIAENAVEDSIDYRFEVYDPFAPIKASMYVVPMGRATVWYIELDESSISTNTGDFVVSVSATTTETVETESTTVVTPSTETVETVIEPTEPEATQTQEPTEDVEAISEEIEVQEEAIEDTEQEIDADLDAEAETEIEETTEEAEEITELEEIEEEQPENEEIVLNETSSSSAYIAIIVIIAAIIAGFIYKRKKK